MQERCDGCGTPFAGRKRHGFIKGRRKVCGRTRVQKSIRTQDGFRLDYVSTPECKA